MKRFRVRWEQKALDELSRLWIQADTDTRNAVTQAAHKIDHRLEEDPHSEGESRPGHRRISFEPPLAITFRIDSFVVSVLHVWLYHKRTSA